MLDKITLYAEDHFGVVISSLLIVLFAVIIGRVVRFFLKRYFERASQGQKFDPTKFRFILNSVPVIIFLAATTLILYITPGGRSLAVSLFAGAGIFAAIIGFASQAAFSNIVSGVFIVIFKPFRVNDQLTLSGDKSGVVEDITLRHTVIRNFENRRIIIPNTVISNETIINSTITDEKICRHVEFSISYDSDVDLAKSIMQEEAMNHPLCIDNRLEEDIANGIPKVMVRLISLGDSSVKLRAWAWANNQPESFQLQCDLNESIKKRFEASGIEIPFPYRTLVFKNQAVSKVI